MEVWPSNRKLSLPSTEINAAQLGHLFSEMGPMVSLETYLELPGTYLLDASISSAIKRVKSEMSPWTEALSNAAM